MNETEFDKKLYDELYPDLTDDELTDEFITMNYRDLYRQTRMSSETSLS